MPPRSPLSDLIHAVSDDPEVKAAARRLALDSIAAAQEIVDLFAANPGVGTIGYKGAMLDRPHLARAQLLLRQAGR